MAIQKIFACTHQYDRPGFVLKYFQPAIKIRYPKREIPVFIIHIAPLGNMEISITQQLRQFGLAICGCIRKCVQSHVKYYPVQFIRDLLDLRWFKIGIANHVYHLIHSRQTDIVPGAEPGAWSDNHQTLQSGGCIPYDIRSMPVSEHLADADTVRYSRPTMLRNNAHFRIHRNTREYIGHILLSFCPPIELNLTYTYIIRAIVLIVNRQSVVIWQEVY